MCAFRDSSLKQQSCPVWRQKLSPWTPWVYGKPNLPEDDTPGISNLVPRLLSTASTQDCAPGSSMWRPERRYVRGTSRAQCAKEIGAGPSWIRVQIPTPPLSARPPTRYRGSPHPSCRAPLENSARKQTKQPAEAAAGSVLRTRPWGSPLLR